MLFRFWVFPDCTFLDISIYCISCLTLVTPVPTLKSAEFSVDMQGEYYGLLPANGRKIMSIIVCE